MQRPQNLRQYLCPSTASAQMGWAVSFMSAQSRTLIMSEHSEGWSVGHAASSDASPQSLSRSHLHVASMQRPLAHWNSSAAHTQFSSSLLSAQSSSPSHCQRASMHLLPSLHLYWLAAHAPVQLRSSRLSPQSSSPLQIHVDSMHR